MILQHVCSVIIFVVCFVCIFQERLSPGSILSWSSAGTFIGWILWERWVAELSPDDEFSSSMATVAVGRTNSLSRRRTRAASVRRPTPLRIESTLPEMPSSIPQCKTPSGLRSASSTSISLPEGATRMAPRAASTPILATRPSFETLQSDLPPFDPGEKNRTHERLGTIKSAALIYSTLLGLSPIVKSLTLSTSSDSIWAISFWLLAVNIFSFDYSGGVGAKFPASLSTNAALMASTVLASRLPSTQQVFSLTLFSIEVFGLFPVFRRHLRHRSSRYHFILTAFLVLGAGWGVGMVLSENKSGRWPWMNGIVGMGVSILLSVLGTGGCTWWLIGLQKYKNEIRGPWDPARPIIMSRQKWEDS